MTTIDTHTLENMVGETVLEIFHVPFVFHALSRWPIKYGGGPYENDPKISGATNGNTIILYDQWFKNSTEERLRTLVHELGHIIHEHTNRAEGVEKYEQNKDITNIAMDISLLDFQEEAGAPSSLWGSFPNIKQLRGHSFEETFEMLIQNQPPAAVIDAFAVMTPIPNGSDGDDESDDSTPTTGSNPATFNVENAIEAAAIADQIQNKNMGTMSGKWLRKIQKSRTKKIKWDRYLTKTAQKMIRKYPAPYPSRRAVYGFIPARYEVPNIEMVFAMDVSGSISGEDIGMMLDVIKKLPRIGIEITLLTWDVKVQQVINVNKTADFNDIKITGGGGTSLDFVFQWIRENMKSKKRTIVIATDGYVTMPIHQPRVNVIWLMTQNCNQDFKPSFGKILKLEKSK